MIDGMKISLDVSNVGNRAGAEVVQLYMGDPVSSVQRPLKELKGFEKVYLEPGQKRTVTFTLTGEDLSFWDEGTRRWASEAGEFDILVGSSSRDIRLQGVFEHAK